MINTIVTPYAFANNIRWRHSIYQGEIYKLPASQVSTELVNAIQQLLLKTFAINELNFNNLVNIHNVLSEADFFAAMKLIRRELFEQPKYTELLSKYLLNLGFKQGEVAFEPLRLRAIRHNGHLTERAKAVYYAHRDTWYGHAQSVIVGWIPLHNQAIHQTFEIYPDWFNRPVSNNSEVFDYNQWRSGNNDKIIGWQKKDTGLTAVYPETTAEVPLGRRIKFSCTQAETLLFSGAHYHQTLKQTRNLSRFSVDYRLIHLADEQQQLGAPNVDNRSRGSALQDYIRL
ncbi:hypothetical protein [Spartinivicinus poritis]|uniref:Uncharacterized protein n=1 Tax=Spartinivicinus poritis TaxID=2994640 RepID=A0ABT5UC24_9GAMM|nr:hypothetical protein [Spartinivicinus sp. A2-2]MDE1463740.1 hypothetical protein [Spartinivicinus sp. A2-2]